MVCIVDYGCMVCVLVFGALLLLADFVAYHDPAPIYRWLNGLSTKFEKGERN